jgi:hypothetical protein
LSSISSPSSITDCCLRVSTDTFTALTLADFFELLPLLPPVLPPFEPALPL